MPDAPHSGPAASLPAPRADVAGLRAFVAVARAGTVARAAGLLGLAQPSVSARLAGLERSWGTRLFRRRARGMTLSPEGTRLLPLAESLLRGLEELDRAAGLPVAPASELRVGAGDALGRERLPRALAALLERDPALEIRIREGPAPRLLEALRDGEIDLALVVGPPAERAGNGVDLEPWLVSDVRLLVPARLTGLPRPPVPLEALAAERLVALQPGSGFRRHLEAAFAAAGLAFRPAVEVGNLSLVRRFVAAGLGVAPAPAIAFSGRASLAGVRFLALDGVAPLTYHRAVRAGAPLPDAAQRLLRLLAR